MWYLLEEHKPFDNALVIVSILGYSQLTSVKWRNGNFYSEDENGLFTKRSDLLDTYVSKWTYFPLDESNENYDRYIQEMKNKKINTRMFVCAFPGTGKSTIYDNCWNRNGLWPLRKNGSFLFRGLKHKDDAYVYDSDSSTFDKADFPKNYIQHMKEVLARHDSDFLFLASSHDTVRIEMTKANLPYLLVYPDRSLKAEYIDRYKKRNSPKAFIDLMESKWDDFITSCELDSAEKIILQSNQYLADVL